MRSPRTLLAIATTVAAAGGCVFVPVTKETYDPDCQVVHRHMELQVVQVAMINNCADKTCQAVAISMAAVTAVSAIVSGSIVIVGNTGYWAERQASCLAPPPAAPA
jgi:hypothetical protein